MEESWPSRLDHDSVAYWRGLSEKRLALARCQACRQWIHPPRACCPVCWSDDIGHESPSGDARLYSYVIQPTEPGGAPRVIGWAELAEQDGVFIVAPIEDVTTETVRIGAKLSLDWVASRNTFLPVFHQEKQ